MKNIERAYMKIGNSTVKMLIGENIIDVREKMLPDIVKNVKEIYYYSTSKRDSNILSLIKKKKMVKVNNDMVNMIGNSYYNKEQLGTDRLLGCSYFFRKYGNDFIYLDLGSIITANIFVQANLIGGYMVPGLKFYLQTFNRVFDFPPKNKKFFIKLDEGKNTIENINAGYSLMYKSFFNEIKNRYQLDIYASGGNRFILPLIECSDYTENCDLLEMRNYDW